MKRFVFGIAGALALVVAGIGYSIGPPGGLPQDKVWGGGGFGPNACFDATATRPAFCFPAGLQRDFSLDVHAAPNGSGVTGTFYYGRNDTSAVVAQIAQVSCIAVDGNRAVIGGLGLAGQRLTFFVIDNGPAGSPTRDRTTATFVNSETEFPDVTDCPDPNTPRFGYTNLVRGDITVVDK